MNLAKRLRYLAREKHGSRGWSIMDGNLLVDAADHIERYRNPVWWLGVVIVILILVLIGLMGCWFVPGCVI